LRGYDKSGAVERIRAAGGEVFAVTSEPQTLASEARLHWKLAFESVGDPHHEIAAECRERGWLHLFVNRDVQPLSEDTGFASHPKGFFQPGVLAVTREGRVLYRWRGRPTRRNAGGATNRPLPEHVWEQTQKALANGAEAEDAGLDRVTEFDMRTPPWPLFVFLLLANGNFLRPRPFPLSRGGPDDIGKRSKRAVAKALLFLVALGVALATLPTAWVLAALAAWGLAITPGVIRLHRHFQSLPDGEPG
jgi:hypothetical protein